MHTSDSETVSKVPGDEDAGLPEITICDLAFFGDLGSLGHCSFSSDFVESPE